MMKKFLAIALILAAAGCARKEAGPVRYDRMELIYFRQVTLEDLNRMARDETEAISNARHHCAYRIATITGQDTLSFISDRIYSAEKDTLQPKSLFVQMVALLHNEDKTDTLSYTMWLRDPFLFNGTPIRDTTLYVFIVDILRDRDRFWRERVSFEYEDGYSYGYPKGYTRQFPEGAERKIMPDSLNYEGKRWISSGFYYRDIDPETGTVYEGLI